MTKKFRRRFFKIIFIISIIIANCYWENSESVELAFRTAQPSKEEYEILSEYAIEIARTRDTNIISEEEIQAQIRYGEKNTLIVIVQNKKCILTTHFIVDEEFQILEDGTFKIEEKIEEPPFKMVGNSKLPSKNSCICTAILICLASFTAMYFLCYNIPRRIINKHTEKIINDF